MYLIGLIRFLCPGSLSASLVMLTWSALFFHLPLLVILMVMLCLRSIFLLALHELSHLSYLIDLRVFTTTYYRLITPKSYSSPAPHSIFRFHTHICECFPKTLLNWHCPEWIPHCLPVSPKQDTPPAIIRVSDSDTITHLLTQVRPQALISPFFFIFLTDITIQTYFESVPFSLI